MHPVLQMAKSLEVGKKVRAAHLKACGSASAAADPSADLGEFSRDAFQCSTERRGRIAMDHSDLKDEDVACFANKRGESIPVDATNLGTAVCVVGGMVVYDGTDTGGAADPAGSV